MRCHLPRRDDPNYLLLALSLHRVNYQQQQNFLNQSDRVPTLLSINNSVPHHHRVWIIKDQRRRLKENSMLSIIAVILVLIPSEDHC